MAVEWYGGADDSSIPMDVADDPDAYEPAVDNPLLQPGSDGLIAGGKDAYLLRELARRREAGASLAALRRDAGQIDPIAVTDRTLEAAIEQGRRLNQWEASGRISERPRQFRGVSVVACRACGRRVLQRALRPDGCALCQALP